MTELVFYTNPMSRGRIARWMLEEVGAPYTTQIIGYGPDMKTGSYAALNPMRKVPALVHDGQLVTEVAAICAYLADAFPGAGLGPQAGERAAYHRALFFAAGPVEHAVTNRAMGVEPTEQQSRMCGYGTYDRMVAVLETMLDGRDFAAGSRFTAADVYLGSQVGWGLRFGTLPKKPLFEAYYARLADRPAHRRAVEIDDALLATAEASA
ncbi:glutathione S-transferase family protein [Sphingomonas sp.]|uniref:glutathione S-transferase family protein n=1 Tax=Sphingomonas sp. TaxID=28214 RepID=UPI001DDAFD77|nr:glutathione S-transferase family protein [Sphingomonas sp.]MBX9796278.1 glutathione S-transferase family protein [Sphingomonas sp.]